MVSGALARAGHSEHAIEANEIDAALIARYRRAQEGRDACDLLAGLGNSVGPSALPVIEEALSDPRTPVRAAAARALRLATGPEIDRWLSAAIASDADPAVRADAIFAAGFHRPLGLPLVDALLRVARGDSVDYVRSNAITLLRRNSDASPDIAKTLAWVAINDPKPGIRRLASEALGTSASR
jgi:HEAT repeat protein